MAEFRTPRFCGRLRGNISDAPWEFSAVRGPSPGRVCSKWARFKGISRDLAEFSEIATYWGRSGRCPPARFCGRLLEIPGGSRARLPAGSVLKGWSIPGSFARPGGERRNRHLLGPEWWSSAPIDSSADCVEISARNLENPRWFADPPGRVCSKGARLIGISLDLPYLGRSGGVSHRDSVADCVEVSPWGPGVFSAVRGSARRPDLR